MEHELYDQQYVDGDKSALAQDRNEDGKYVKRASVKKDSTGELITD